MEIFQKPKNPENLKQRTEGKLVFQSCSFISTDVLGTFSFMKFTCLYFVLILEIPYFIF